MSRDSASVAPGSLPPQWDGARWWRHDGRRASWFDGQSWIQVAKPRSWWGGWWPIVVAAPIGLLLWGTASSNTGGELYLARAGAIGQAVFGALAVGIALGYLWGHLRRRR